MKTIVRIVSVIVAIAAGVSIIAGIAQLFETKSDNHKPNGPYEKYFKRMLDAFFSTGALIVFSPILIITAILIRMKLGSPVLFAQERPGRDEKIFKLYKFRTMTDQKDENGNLLPDEIRLTSFGKRIRATSLDELPELINIVKGDMAVIGPRPLLVKYLPYYSNEERERHSVRPGLTGLAQVNGRNRLGWSARFKMDCEYAHSISFRGDVKIFFDTILKVAKKSDVTINGDYMMENLDEERCR